MTLKRFEVLIINSTITAGVLVLLTISDFVIGKEFFLNTDFILNLDYLILSFSKFYVQLFITLSILPFTISSIIEIRFERIMTQEKNKRILLKELKKHQENEKMDMKKIIKKELTKYKNINISNTDYDIRNLLHEHDCATIKGIMWMYLGFAYLTVTVAIFPFFRIIN